MLPILRQTLSNYEVFGAEGAFSGPIIRGDSKTVESHLRILRNVPLALDVYKSLAQAALAYLPGKNKRMIEKSLKSMRVRD